MKVNFGFIVLWLTNETLTLWFTNKYCVTIRILLDLLTSYLDKPCTTVSSLFPDKLLLLKG